MEKRFHPNELPWAPRRLDDSPTLFPLTREQFLIESGASLGHLRDWHKAGWLSFSPDENEQFEEFHLAEVDVVRSVIDSGLPEQAAGRILNQLAAPFRYDTRRLCYNFFLRRWQMVPGVSLEAIRENFFKEFLEEYNADDAVEAMEEAGDLDGLLDLMTAVGRAIQRVRYRRERNEP